MGGGRKRDSQLSTTCISAPRGPEEKIQAFRLKLESMEGEEEGEGG